LDLIDNIEKKAAFLIPESIFEPTVMFFRLTNSLVTFQKMMNDFLRDIIKVKNMSAFIDNVMVEIETEEEHNDIVKEV